MADSRAGTTRRDRRARLWGAAGMVPIVLSAAIRLGAVGAVLSLALTGAISAAIFVPLVRRARAEAARDRFEPGLFECQASVPVITALRLSPSRSAKDPRPWRVRALTNGLAMGRLRVEPGTLSFTTDARNGGEALTFELDRGDFTIRHLDTDDRRAALFLEAADGTEVVIRTGHPTDLARVIESGSP